MAFPSSPDSAQNQRWAARTKNEKGLQSTTDKGLHWVEEEKRTRAKQEMKVKEQEVKVREEVEKRRRDEIAKRQVEEKAERERRAESEMRDNLERQRRLEAELVVKEEERERRMKEETDYRGTEKSEGLKRLVEPKKKEEETLHRDQVNRMKKIEVHSSSSSSLSEEDSLSPSWQVSTSSWQAQPQQNSSSSTHLQFSPSPTRVALNQHSETRISLESNTPPVTTMTVQNWSAAQDVQVRPSVDLEPDSEATSDYSESDLGSPFVVKRAVPVHQHAPSASGSPVSVKKAIPVQQESSQEETSGSDSEADVRQAISGAGLSGTVRQAQPVAGLSESDDEEDAAFVRRAIPVVATDTDSADSSNEPGQSKEINSSGSPRPTNSVKLLISPTAAPRPMTRVETLSDSSTMTEEDGHDSPPIRKAVPIIATDSSSNSSGSDSDSDSRPALPMTRVNRALSVISEVGEAKVIAREVWMLLTTCQAATHFIHIHGLFGIVSEWELLFCIAEVMVPNLRKTLSVIPNKEF